jgi:hypothetical protein
MNHVQLTEFLAGLALAKRAQALNLLSFKLTIHAREYGLLDAGADKEEAIRRLVGLSELHHKLTSQTGHYLDGDEATAYPVAVFSQILFDVANQYNVTGALNAALKSVLENSSFK